MTPKDGCYYWIEWKHRPGKAVEWMVALYVQHAGWQIPGVLYSTDTHDPRILQVGNEVVREAA